MNEEYDSSSGIYSTVCVGIAIFLIVLIIMGNTPQLGGGGATYGDNNSWNTTQSDDHHTHICIGYCPDR